MDPIERPIVPPIAPAMTGRRSRLRAGVLALLVGATAVAHYATPIGPEHHALHALWRWLFHLPILLGAFWFGLRGGILTAVVASAVYAPHVLVQWNGGMADQWIYVLQYNVIGAVTGWLAGGLRAESARYRHTAENLDRALRDLHQQTRVILDAEERLRRAERLSVLGELGATLAHEVRTPLASIRGTAEILSDAFDRDDERYEFARILLKEVDRLNRVVTEFLAGARPVPAPAVRCELAETIGEVVRLVRPTAERQGVAIETAFDGVAETRVRFDPEHLRQVFVNLLVNALEAMPGGGRVEVTAAGPAPGGAVDVTVGDTGPGVPEGDRGQIFEPFFTTKTSGTGLGLSAVRRILEAGGGSIRLAERDGHAGARFVVTLPLGEEEGSDGRSG